MEAGVARTWPERSRKRPARERVCSEVEPEALC
jgi:hypothetical protein